MVRLSIVAIVVVASLAVPAPARSADVRVQVNIGQPPVMVAQPVLVPVQQSPVYYVPAYDGDLFFYGGRYYTVRDDHWFYAARPNTPWIAVSIGRVPQAVLAVPVQYYRVKPAHLKHHCPPGQAKKGRC